MTEQKMDELFQKGIKLDRAGNFTESIKIHKQLAELGHVESMFNYGWAFHEGFGVPVNMKQSFDWQLKAANAGHARAQFNIGIFYDTGLAGEKNYEKALHYFLLASKQGIDEAQRNAALMLLKGDGCDKDELQAEDLLLSAAEQGLTEACYNLGNLYFKRAAKDELQFSKRINLQSARKWFCKAEENGDASAKVMVEKIDRALILINDGN